MQSTEAAIVQQFEEVKRHKPSVIYIPSVDLWYRTLGDAAIRTFTGLLRSLPPTEPVLLLALLETGPKESDEETQTANQRLEKKMLQDLFGYSMKNQYILDLPDKPARMEYFNTLMDYIRKAPSDFPEAENRKRRKIEELPVAPDLSSTPTGPTKAELRAQKKKDRQTLNLLKLHIQSVMDQIKLKYKKFRTPIVEDRDIAYLYEERDPQILTTDLTEEQRQQQHVFRPYEVEPDEKGVLGLREQVTKKFYYNLEIVTIEKRLSNGYYKRPSDFLADIKRLAKDAKTAGDEDRTIKANEMQTNVEVDMDMLEQQQPALVAECEALYEREQQRERERLQKVREAENRGEDVPRIVPNLPPPNASKTTTEASGPVVLGQVVPGGRPTLLPVTPGRMHGPGPTSYEWSSSGGDGKQSSRLTNGSAVPSRPNEDLEMVDSQVEMFEDAGQDQRLHTVSTPSHPNTQGPLSQKSAHTRVAQGSQVEQYHNSASTTTSGQKTSDKSNRSSGPYSVNTQISNGIRHADHPDFSILPEAQGGSELPDTQPEHHLSQLSQPMAPPAPPPPHPSGSISAILNNPSGTPQDHDSAPAPLLVLDDASVNAFQHQLVNMSSGLSVEQLEQVNASMMEVIWKDRMNWNRLHVLKKVQDAFNEKIEDIEMCQYVHGPSQPKTT